MNVELSQGSHFFHNLSSFRASYFMVRHDGQIRHQLGLAEPATGGERDRVGSPRAAFELDLRFGWMGARARGVILAGRTTARPGRGAMNREETQVTTILRELQERAKELNCLYRVDELLNQPELPLEHDLPRNRRDPAPRMAVSARLPGANRLREQVDRVSELPADQLDAERQICGAGRDSGQRRSLLPRADAALRRRPVPEGRAQAHRDHRRSHRRPHHATAAEVGVRRA